MDLFNKKKVVRLESEVERLALRNETLEEIQKNHTKHIAEIRDEHREEVEQLNKDNKITVRDLKEAHEKQLHDVTRRAEKAETAQAELEVALEELQDNVKTQADR